MTPSTSADSSTSVDALPQDPSAAAADAQAVADSTTADSADVGETSGGAVAKPICEPPLTLVQPGSDAQVVGDGTAQSCTLAALQAAVAQGGFISFAWGAQPTTLAVTATLTLPTDRDTTLAGGGLVTLDGGDDAACVPGITWADPQLGALGPHGGAVPTVLVAAGSPALTAGVDCPPTDARGKARPAQG